MRVLAVIPSRYDPKRLKALLPALADVDVLVLDNGHKSPLKLPVRVMDSRGLGIYAQWNLGWKVARDEGYDVVALLNDDIRIHPGTVSRMAEALVSDPGIGIVYPDWPLNLTTPLPDELILTPTEGTVTTLGMTGFSFAFRPTIDVPPFDEGFGWWFGDDVFERTVRKAGLKICRIQGLPCEHVSDSEANDWARRPELKDIAEQDRLRWLAMQSRPGRVVFLVPRRKDSGHRDRLWEYCRARWETLFPDIPIYEGHHEDGPFNRSAAVNRASALAGEWDHAIVIDSDVMLAKSQAERAIETAQRTGKVTWGHRRWRGIREDWAVRIIADQKDLGPEFENVDMDVLVERTNPISWSCFQVIPRAVWDDTGGFDERFVGWGYEDMAWQSLICGLYGHERIEGDVIHLWHERSEERIVKGQPAFTATAEYNRNARLGRRYMVAARRLGFHDRLEPSDAAEMERDIANLLRDDEKVALRQTPAERKQFDGWWPTLEELRDGAKNIHDSETVTLVVHTDGRREYIAESIASLQARVSGPIVKRVIYDDSGDPGYKAWLTETFGRETLGEQGFYIVGPRQRLGYSGSMRAMWEYLATRCSTEFVFQVEDDFVYEREVDLLPMIQTLRENPHLRQLALLREAYYPREFEAGGVIESLPTPVELKNSRPFPFLEHRDHFTANPSLFRRSLTRVPWPTTNSSERGYTDVLNRDPASRFAYWGSGEAWIRHIGAERSPAAAGY